MTETNKENQVLKQVEKQLRLAYELIQEASKEEERTLENDLSSKAEIESLKKENANLKGLIQELERKLDLLGNGPQELRQRSKSFSSLGCKQIERPKSFRMTGTIEPFPKVQNGGKELGSSLGPDALRKYEILARETDLKLENLDHSRSGFRLLMCSDKECEVQTFEDGFLSVSHLTKVLVKLKWLTVPKLALIIKRPGDVATTAVMIEAIAYLKKHNVDTLVEESVIEEIKSEKGFDEISNSVHVTKSREASSYPIDFIVCLGGDGTIIWTSSLFPDGMPPVISYAMGSLGFLTPFAHERMTHQLNQLVTSPDTMEVTIRARIQIEVFKFKGDQKELAHVQTYSVLNEVVVDRGPSSSLVHVDLYAGDTKEPITTVQGDGIIIATPTGSTAYSLAAGGSMIHPAIPAMAITPICPHTLSFRPIVVADSTTIEIKVPDLARTSAQVSFDGRNTVILHHGEKIRCTVSDYPLLSFCKVGESKDWYAGMKDSFYWNERRVQRKLTTTKSSKY